MLVSFDEKSGGLPLDQNVYVPTFWFNNIGPCSYICAKKITKNNNNFLASKWNQTDSLKCHML